MNSPSRQMGTNSGRAQVADHRPFDYQLFYRGMEECLRLQLSRDEVTWVQRYERPEHPAQVVLNLSCGVQTTPHIMRTQVALFEALGVDFVATGGIQFCCGRPFQRRGKGDVGDRLAGLTIDRLVSWRPTINVQCCGSCLVEFQHHVAELEASTGTAPFRVVHITQFLLDTLRRLGPAVPWQPSPSRRVLLHAEGAEVHVTKEEARGAVIETLDLIPSVEYAGLVENPSMGAPCGRALADQGGLFTDMTSAQYRQVQIELEAQADAVGADAIVTHHHKCHREWSKFGSARLPVINYQTLLAEALGMHIPDRFQTLWHLGDEHQVLERSRPHWESWGVAEEDARLMVRRLFVPVFASEIQQCPCEGSCDSALAGSDGHHVTVRAAP